MQTIQISVNFINSSTGYKSLYPMLWHKEKA